MSTMVDKAVDAKVETLRIGTTDTGRKTRAVLSVTVTLTGTGSGSELRIQGQETRPAWKAIDSGGQIVMHLPQLIEAGAIEYADGWDDARLKRLVRVWEDWHLNQMRSGCEHQRLWDWQYDEHPSQPCPVCGYRLGSAWRFEELPQAVLDYLEAGCP